MPKSFSSASSETTSDEASGSTSEAGVMELARLTWADLTWGDNPPHAVVRLAPLNKGPEQHKVPIMLAPGDGSGADAYARLDKMEREDPVDPSLRQQTPLFTNRGKKLTPRVITSWVQGAARAAGDPRWKQFTGRSLRIGGATAMHALGVNPASIQALGRWAGDTQRIYTRMTASQALAISAQLGHAAGGPTLEDVFADYTQTARR